MICACFFFSIYSLYNYNAALYRVFLLFLAQLTRLTNCRIYGISSKAFPFSDYQHYTVSSWLLWWRKQKWRSIATKNQLSWSFCCFLPSTMQALGYCRLHNFESKWNFMPCELAMLSSKTKHSSLLDCIRLASIVSSHIGACIPMLHTQAAGIVHT